MAIALIGLSAATLAVAALVVPHFQALRYPSIFDKKFFVQTMISIGTAGATLSFACLLAGHFSKPAKQDVQPLTKKAFNNFKSQSRNPLEPSPKLGTEIGKGSYGGVYETESANIVFKKFNDNDPGAQISSALESCSEADRQGVEESIYSQKPDLEMEFFIGNQLDHQLFAKSLVLFEDGFTMERVEGIMLKNLDKAAYIAICKQLRDACLHLFDKGVYWADLSLGNILWQSDDNTIKLIDFGAWRIEECDAKRAKHLLLNAYRILHDLSLSFASPDVHKKENFYGLNGFNEISKFTTPDQVQTLNVLFGKNKTKEEMRSILAHYFDVIIKNIQDYQGAWKNDNIDETELNDDDVVNYMNRYL